MTMHSAKGLEFGTVFLVGLYQGNLPYDRAKTEAELEEEQRLLYVAITRAKHNLFVSYGKSKHIGAKRTRAKSQFLEKLWPSTPVRTAGYYEQFKF
jgi:DNA helicase-2/ATP-dependent DNA helicase PcrA